jgi:hypothetical protein
VKTEFLMGKGICVSSAVSKSIKAGKYEFRNKKSESNTSFGMNKRREIRVLHKWPHKFMKKSLTLD